MVESCIAKRSSFGKRLKRRRNKRVDVLQKAKMPTLYTMRLDRDCAPCVYYRNTLWPCSNVLCCSCWHNELEDKHSLIIHKKYRLPPNKVLHITRTVWLKSDGCHLVELYVYLVLGTQCSLHACSPTSYILKLHRIEYRAGEDKRDSAVKYGGAKLYSSQEKWDGISNCLK